MEKQKISFLLETIFDESARKVSLRVNVRRGNTNKSKASSVEDITKLLQQRGYGCFYQFEEQIKIIADDLLQRIGALEEGSTLYDDIFETPTVAEARDAIAEVRITDDALEAYLKITPARGGVQLDLDSAKSLLVESGVVYGVEDQLLFNLLSEARASQSGEPLERLVAKATPAVDGEDTQFLPQVETANERILKPQLRADGTIDMRELGNLPMVKANDIIMRKELFTLGVKGTDVLGKDIIPEPGQDFEFTISPGSMINPDNPAELIAETNGMPNLTSKGMKVDNVVKVKAVDLSTGNLNIDANLYVSGDIRECMKVKCSGDITVGGVIESADVQADGSITVGKGIVGQPPHHHQGQEDKFTTLVRAGDSINAVFASYATLEAGNKIHMDEQLLHCDSTSHGVVIVGNKKTVGAHIVGGITRAKSLIESDIVGSHAGILTKFDLSAVYHEKQQDISVFEHEIEGKEKQLNQLTTTFARLTGHHLSPAHQIQATKLKNTILHFKKLLAELENEARIMRNERDIALHKIKLVIKRRVHPLVEVQIGVGKFRSKRAMESGIIALTKSEVCYQSENLDNKK